MRAMAHTGRAPVASRSPPAALGAQRALGAEPAHHSSGGPASDRTHVPAQGAFLGLSSEH